MGESYFESSKFWDEVCLNQTNYLIYSPNVNGYQAEIVDPKKPCREGQSAIHGF